MVYYDDISFVFADPYPAGYLPGMIVLLFLYLVLLIVVLILLHRRRHNLVVSLRGVSTLSFSLIWGYIFTVIFVVSILIGKPATCELLGFVYALYVPFCCSHLVFLHPVVLTAYRINTTLGDLKTDSDSVNNAGLGGEFALGGWKLQKYFTNRMQFLYMLLSGVVGVGVYCGVHWGLQVKVPGECNRDALLVGCASMMLLFLSVLVFVSKLQGVSDPVFYRIQVRCGLLALTGPTFITFIYPLGPHLFPPWFDYRWTPVFGNIFILIVHATLPVLLSFERVQAVIRPSRMRSAASTEMNGIQANQTMLTLHTGRELFRSCLENPVLLKSFTQFMRSIWCVENVVFYCEVNEYRRLAKSSPEQAKTRGLSIIHQCVAPRSLLEINVDHPTRRELMELVHGAAFSETSFDRAQSEVYRLMAADSFEKWIQTTSFSDALEEAVKNLQLNVSS